MFLSEIKGYNKENINLVSHISQTCNKTIKIRQTCSETKEKGDPREEREKRKEERKDKREKRRDMDIYLFFSYMWHGWVYIKGTFYLKVGFTHVCLIFVVLLHV